jgi:hypothetical protein
MQLILTLDNGNELFLEELNDAKELKVIQFDLDQVVKFELDYSKSGSVIQRRLDIDIENLSTEDKKETFYKYLYIVDNFGSLESLYDEIDNKEDLESVDYYPNAEEFFNTFYMDKPYKLVQAIAYGDYRYSDNFVKFDGYANLKSVYEIPYEDDCAELVSRYFEQESPEMLWTVQFTATHSSGFSTTLEREFYSEVNVDENAKEEIREAIAESYEELDELEDVNEYNKVLIEKIGGSDVDFDDDELSDWTFEFVTYTV